MPASPLRHFPSYRTRDAKAASAYLNDYFHADFEVTDDAPNLGFTINRVHLREITLVYSISTFGFRAQFSGTDVIQQRICLSGKGRVTYARGAANLTPHQWSATLPAGESGHVEFSPGYAGMRMVVDDSVMRRKLGALIGDAPVDRIAFSPNTDIRSPGLARYRRLLSFLLSELDAGGPQAPGLVIDEIAEALLVSYLCGHQHNYSLRLLKPELALSSMQQCLAEQYIAAHWNKALRVEEIAKAANVSARSIFRSFRDTHGCSPFQYVKRVRLRHARDMLLEQESQSVVSVALKCGFQSLGHFASSYRNAFGELPSQTARR